MREILLVAEGVSLVEEEPLPSPGVRRPWASQLRSDIIGAEKAAGVIGEQEVTVGLRTELERPDIHRPVTAPRSACRIGSVSA